MTDRLGRIVSMLLIALFPWGAAHAVSPDRLMDALKKRGEDLQPLMAARNPSTFMSPQFSWRDYQPIRLALSPELRAIGYLELEKALAESPIDWEHVEKCMLLLLCDVPDLKCEQLIVQTLEKLEEISIARILRCPLFDYLVRNLANQETENAQNILLELIAPDFERGFKTVANHCFDIVAKQEIEALSDFVAGHMLICSDLDFTHDTFKKSLNRLSPDMHLATLLKKHLEILEKKMAGNPFPDGATP